MSVVKLTKKAVDAAVATKATLYLWDDDVKGFGLKVTANGVKTYILQYRLGGRSGKSRRYSIGRHGNPWTPDSARKRAMVLLGEIAQGKDVVAERQREIAEAQSGSTIAELVDRFEKRHLLIKCKPRTSREAMRLMQRFVLPIWGKRLTKDISRADVSRLHHDLAGTPLQANRVLSHLSKMFNLAEVWGERPDYSNPCRRVEKYKENRRERYLKTDEIARLLDVLDSYCPLGHLKVAPVTNVVTMSGAPLRSVKAAEAMSPFAVAAIKLLLFTGARHGEIINMQWEWVDFENSEVHLPDSKTGAKTIHLSAEAVEVLRQVPRVVGCPYVIAGVSPGKPLQGLQNIWERIRQQAGLSDVRLHDLRHTYASIAVNAGMSLPIIGKMLGHTQAQTTMRYAHLAAEPVKAATALVGERLAAVRKPVHIS